MNRSLVDGTYTLLRNHGVTLWSYLHRHKLSQWCWRCQQMHATNLPGLPADPVCLAFTSIGAHTSHVCRSARLMAISLIAASLNCHARAVLQVLFEQQPRSFTRKCPESGTNPTTKQILDSIRKPGLQSEFPLEFPRRRRPASAFKLTERSIVIRPWLPRCTAVQHTC